MSEMVTGKPATSELTCMTAPHCHRLAQLIVCRPAGHLASAGDVAEPERHVSGIIEPQFSRVDKFLAFEINRRKPVFLVPVILRMLPVRLIAALGQKMQAALQISSASATLRRPVSRCCMTAARSQATSRRPHPSMVRLRGHPHQRSPEGCPPATISSNRRSHSSSARKHFFRLTGRLISMALASVEALRRSRSMSA